MKRYDRAMLAAMDQIAAGVQAGEFPFPFFFAHRDAACSKCDAGLHRLKISGAPPMRGQFMGTCAECGTLTWYDCAEGGVELANLNEYRNEGGSRGTSL